MKPRIYLDMDGVLADFDRAIGHLERPEGYTGGTYIHLPKDQWTPEQLAYDKLVKDCMDQDDFWPMLPVMPGAHFLYSSARALGDVKMLTARPNETKRALQCAAQKRAWMRNNIDPMIPDDEIIVCLRAEKAQYAKDAILIDDMAPNCQHWREAGGHAIQFQSSEQAIAELRSHIQEKFHV